MGLRPRVTVGGQHDRELRRPRPGPASFTRAESSWPTLGGPHPYLAWLSVNEASACFLAGDWRATTELLRVALGSDPGTAADVQARLMAAVLAVAQGRQHEAEDHLARADELSADTTAFLAWQFDATRSLVRTGAGDSQGAYAAAMTGLLSAGVPPTMCEWLCPSPHGRSPTSWARRRSKVRTPASTSHVWTTS